jgi:hypothetical protein
MLPPSAGIQCTLAPFKANNVGKSLGRITFNFHDFISNDIIYEQSNSEKK